MQFVAANHGNSPEKDGLLKHIQISLQSAAVFSSTEELRPASNELVIMESLEIHGNPNEFLSAQPCEQQIMNGLVVRRFNMIQFYDNIIMVYHGYMIMVNMIVVII